MRVGRMGQLLFAVTLVALGLQGLAQGDFSAIWQPVPALLAGRAVLTIVCALVSLATGAGLLWPRSAMVAARILFGWLLLWLLLWKGRGIWLSSGAVVSLENAGETAVLAAAAAMLAGDRMIRPGRVLYGLALIAFGLAHLTYVADTASIVPAWLPAPVFWVYLTGGTYIAAGLAVAADRLLARLAATLAAVQIGLFTLLVWIPAITGGNANAAEWSETILSWTLTAAAWVVAESYRDRPWR